MRRFVLAALTAALLGVLPVLAQQPGHVVTMPDTLRWVEPPTLPEARLAVLQGDPSKDGLFVYRLKMPHPHFAWAGGQETVVQVHGVGPTDLTFVNPGDDPRKK
jgi:hypothetical protein